MWDIVGAETDSVNQKQKNQVFEKWGGNES